jgi:hypothetical protein
MMGRKEGGLTALKSFAIFPPTHTKYYLLDRSANSWFDLSLQLCRMEDSSGYFL